VGWQKNGAYWVSGYAGDIAPWTVGDVLKFVKTGSTVSLYKNDVLQITMTNLPALAAGSVYPHVASGNATGFKVTADFSGWGGAAPTPKPYSWGFIL
jgi:hypothetical protein